MSDNPEALHSRIEIIRNSFIDAREKLESSYSFDKDDARITIFNKCTNVMGSVQLGFVLMINQVSKTSWWQQNVKYGYDPNTIQTYANEFNMFFRIGFIHFIFASIESSFRIYVRQLDSQACSNGTDDFKNIYEWLLARLNLKQYTTLLDLIRNVRNSLHNNGLFFPKNGENSTITYKGTSYLFEVGKPNNFVTWNFVFDLMPDVEKMLYEIMDSNELSSQPKIPEPT